MARPKVPDDKRQRTAQACGSCKRRKQKCNGLKPCDTCTKRNLACAFTATTDAPSFYPGPGDFQGSPNKRHHLETPPASYPQSTSSDASSSARFPDQPAHPALSTEPTPPLLNPVPPLLPQDRDSSTLPPPFPGRRHAPPARGTSNDFVGDTPSIPDEEAPVYPSSRMMQNSAGRLLYLGDSAALSYLHLVRMMLQDTMGPSPFTEDPSRHQLPENTVSLPPNFRPSHVFLPPDRQTALVLLESFFTNTMGLVEVFDRAQFRASTEALYAYHPNTHPPFLCLSYLVFAIGLTLARPAPGTHEEAVVGRLRNDHLDWAEVFYRSARDVADPVSGIEDADLWSIQALLLMSIYMLCISKQSAAYAFHGMAVRSAYALGLHREESVTGPAAFGAEDPAVRRNLWRTLFVLDRFLSASLGRPAAISEQDCSDDALDCPPAPPEEGGGGPGGPDAIHAGGLDAAVRSSQVIGVVLREVYSRGKISTGRAQEIADMSKGWAQKLHPSLHWRQAAAGPIAASHGVAILHTNLLHCHTIILLTRPFFLCMVTRLQQARAPGDPLSLGAPSGKMGKFAQACAIASYHTIYLVQKAHMDGHLPQRNPFVLYFLFSATLVVLTNEFASLYHSPSHQSCLAAALSITAYCASSTATTTTTTITTKTAAAAADDDDDHHASRLLRILTDFRDAVASRQAPRPPFPVAAAPDYGLRAATDLVLDFSAPGAPGHIPAPADADAEMDLGGLWATPAFAGPGFM